MLTQAEIDALLAGELNAQKPAPNPEGQNAASDVPPAERSTAAVAGGGHADRPVQRQEKSIRPYNFWSPDVFSKDQLRAVELIHEDLAERLTTTLPTILRTDFRLRLALVDQGRFDDLIGEPAPATLLNVLTLDPLPGYAVLIISSEISWVMLERMLGGSGRGERRENGSRTHKLTDIGQTLLRSVVEHILDNMKASWSKMVDLTPRLDDSTPHHNRVRMLMGSARVVLVTFEMVIQGVSGTISLYIPFAMLKPVAEVLNPHRWVAGQEKQRRDDTDHERLQQHILGVRVPLSVVLGMAELTMADLAHLSPGDVIALQTPVGRDLPVLVGGHVHYLAQPGRLERKLAVRISATIEPGGVQACAPPQRVGREIDGRDG